MSDSTARNKTGPFSKAISFLASLELTIIAIVLLVLFALAGAWIPQQDSVDQAELLKKYGTDGLAFLKYSGLTNVYQSIPFLSTVALLFVNLMACTLARMAPRIRMKLRNQDFFESCQISKFNENILINLALGQEEAHQVLKTQLQDLGYNVHRKYNKLIIEKGRFGWLAAPVTHLGLFILIVGVTITAVTSSSGRIDLLEGQDATLSAHMERKPLFGASPQLHVKLLSTRREDNKDGSPKQWYSSLAVLGKNGEPLAGSDLSVNNPWTYSDVDFSQSDWKVAGVKIILGGNELTLPVQEMGHDSMAVLPLSEDLLMVLALKDTASPLRLYFKHSESKMPRLFATLAKGETTKDCPVPVSYQGTILQSGMQFKKDPGLPVTYLAFFVLFLGAVFVATPAQRIWASVEETDSGSQVVLGFNGLKTANLMRRDLRQLQRRLQPQTDQSNKQLEVTGIDG